MQRYKNGIFQPVLPALATLLWLALIILLLILWDVKVRFGLRGILLPYLILFLSPYVFNRVAPHFRRVHHFVLFPSLFISLAFSYYATHHYDDNIMVMLISYGTIAGYLIFISLFLSALALRYFRRPS